MVRKVTSQELQQVAALRVEVRDLQRQNTLLQRCLAQIAVEQTAMWELLRITAAKKNKNPRLTQ